MTTTLTTLQPAYQEYHLSHGLRLAARVWGEASWAALRPSFVLAHGLSSNARTWDKVARQLASAGHYVVAVDQRGHGLSDKPAEGYDFEQITADLRAFIDQTGGAGLRPILAGQSWGGNVALAFGARYPGVTRALIFVDGGFLNLRSRGLTWEEVAAELRPPDLRGVLRARLKDWIHHAHPDWDDEGLEATLGNFETLSDGSVRPWLSLERHLRILHAMWEQDPPALYPQVQEPVLICPAEDGSPLAASKRRLVAQAQAGLVRAEVVWFPDTAHDIHIDRPQALAAQFLQLAARLDA